MTGLDLCGVAGCSTDKPCRIVLSAAERLAPQDVDADGRGEEACG